MTDMGIMVYGYCQKDAEAMTAALASALGRDIQAISGSGREEDTVMDILDSGAADGFQEKDPGVLMLMGFDDEDISKALEAFPKDVRRPIFCTPTEKNVGWKLKDLIADLLKEREFFKNMLKAAGPRGPSQAPPPAGPAGDGDIGNVRPSSRRKGPP